MAGTVATFYSYKGGVGRSFAMVNIGVIAAQWGARVLLVDWDIEAPGLTHYFPASMRSLAAPRGGVLDFIRDCQKGTPSSFDQYISRIDIPGSFGELNLMASCSDLDDSGDYTSMVQSLDWDGLYQTSELGVKLEALRGQWIANFDLVLIDSRTGITDFSGLTTAQLPDVLVFMFTANNQSLMGCVDVVRRSLEARRGMPLDRPAILPLPIPARFEQREEYDRAAQWKERFFVELSPFLRAWAPAGLDTRKLIDLLTVPYVPRWTFGEELSAAIEQPGSSGTRTPGQLVSHALETIAALLVQRMSKVELLVSSRDDYVHTAISIVRGWKVAPSKGKRLFVSRTHEDRTFVNTLINIFAPKARALGYDPISDDLPSPGLFNLESPQSDIAQADGYLVVFGNRSGDSASQTRVIESLLRQSFRNDKNVPIIPLVLIGRGEHAFEKSRLADYRAVYVADGPDLTSQLQPALDRLARSQLS